MAKLIALVLAFSALVALASAHSTIITTTIEDENPVSRQQCSPQIQGKRFNQCQRYLQGQSWIEKIIPGQMQGGLQSCCQELKYVDEQCQCEAVKEAFRQAQQQQQQQGGFFGSQSQQLREMKEKAQDLPNQCRLQTRQQCQVGTISITTTTITQENPMQMCQHIRQRRFNQCQNYFQKQMGTLLMSINRKSQQTQGVQQCCNELLNVEQECQCEAMQQVYWQVQQMQKQGRQSQTQDLKWMVENLVDQCGLQVQQCTIPSAMF